MTNQLKTLTMVVSSFGRPRLSELLRREAADECPRVSLFETTLHSDMLDENMLHAAPPVRRFVYRLLPPPVAKVLEAFRLRNQYDAIISWGERVAFLFALLLKITRQQKPHIALVYWISKSKQAPLLRKAQSRIDRIITWSSVQRNHGVNVLGIPPSRIRYVPYCVDHKFWRPMSTETNTICSVGEEMRDYPTLIEAMKGLNIPCHIVAGHVRIIGQYTSEWKPISELGPLPPNITVGLATHKELRELYARSRFVVIPLLPSETSSGLTVLLEAMAMGKAVICTRSDAQIDVIQEGRTGIFVPQGDPHALLDAIQYLWDNPSIADEMGKRARAYVEEHHTMERFVDSVKEIVEEVVEMHSRSSKSLPVKRDISPSYAINSTIRE